MAKHKITCYLTEQSFKDAIEELRAYKRELERKIEQFNHEMLLHGYAVTNATVNSISPFYKGDDISVSISETKSNGVYEGIISLSGEQAFFIEFGSGITFNTSKGGSLHPKGEELGLTIGSYNPDSDNATNPSGWWYRDKYDQAQHTYGTPTYMPLERGLESIIADINSIARSVFG